MLRCEAIQTLYQLLILKNQIMKKTFLNLRKMGFVLLAAGSMVAISCGGETAEDEATDAANDLIESLNEAADEMEEAMDEAMEELEEVVDTTAEGACEEGACEDGACEGGDHSCDHGE